MHGIHDLIGIGIIAIAAALCGMTAVQFRQPPIIGYIFAGLALGPSGLALVTERETIELFAEFGVILLLFFIGLELSLQSFRQIWHKAVFIALAQIGLSLGAVFLIKPFLLLTGAQATLFAFCIAVSSTAVAVTVVREIGEGGTRCGQISIGVLIAQDLAVAPLLLIINGLADTGKSPLASFGIIAAEVTLSVALLVVVILILLRKKNMSLPFSDLLLTKKDLAPLATLSWCFGFAIAAGVFGLSPAFGAFLAGLVVGSSAQRHFAMESAEPIQVVLLMCFFLSVGLLIELDFIFENIWRILGFLVAVTCVKFLINVIAFRASGEDWRVALMGSMLLGQLGEFSFVFGAAALSIGILDAELQKYLISLTVASLIISPICVNGARNLKESPHLHEIGDIIKNIVNSLKKLGGKSARRNPFVQAFLHPIRALAVTGRKFIKRKKINKEEAIEEIDALF